MHFSADDVRTAYRTMRLIREFEEHIHRGVMKGEIPGFVHLSAGQEACPVGVCMHLGDEDAIASTHRGHGHAIAKGCDMKAMMKEIYAKRDGICKGKGGSMHMADLSLGMLGANAIVGAGAPLVCGAALHAKYRGNGAVAATFFGDGAYNQGTVLESMNLAVVWELPMIFVLENNGYGEATPADWAIGGDIMARAEGFGLRAVAVDGHDVADVHRGAGELIERARAGDGPGLLHVKLTRYYGHFEGDAATYRPKGEADEAKKSRDCLKLLREKALAAELVTEKELDAIDEELRGLIEEAVEEAKRAEAPREEDLLTDVYVSY